MFSDIKEHNLRQRYFVQTSVAQSKAQDFNYFCQLAQAVCKEADNVKRCEFLFNLFSGYENSIKRDVVWEFINFFLIDKRPGIELLEKIPGSSLTKEQFLQLTNDPSVEVNFEIYEAC